MIIRNQLVSNTSARYAGKNPKISITVHETGNTHAGADAGAHANLQSRGNSRLAAWHWQVDDKEAVRSFSEDFRLWHAGDGYRAGNLSSIAIEICVNSDGNQMQAYRNAAILVRRLQKAFNIPTSRVYQHYNWSRKNCPTGLRGNSKGLSWGGFINLVSSGVISGGASTPPPKPVTSTPKNGFTDIDGKMGHGTVRFLQNELSRKRGNRRYSGANDGFLSEQGNSVGARTVLANPIMYNGAEARVGRGSDTVFALQNYIIRAGFSVGTMGADRFLGKNSIMGLQRLLTSRGYYNSIIDGVLSAPVSATVNGLQRMMTDGKL